MVVVEVIVVVTVFVLRVTVVTPPLLVDVTTAV